MRRICRTCFYRNRDNVCMLKNIDLNENFIEDCWFKNEIVFEEEEENVEDEIRYYIDSAEKS